MSLANKTIGGVLWALTTSFGTRIITLIGTLILARHIDPAEYGEVLGAAVVATSAFALSSLGLGQYIVARPNAGRDHVFHVTFFGSAIGAVILACATLLGPFLGARFNVPHMMRYLPWLALGAMIDRVTSVPERVLTRDMRFRPIGLTKAVGELLYTVVSLTSVLTGHGGMSIVYGCLARGTFRLLSLGLVLDRREWLSWCPIRWDATREIFRFGLPLQVGNLADNFARSWDRLLVSRLFGSAVTGSYNYAYEMSDVPASHLGEQIGDVLLPSFANLKTEHRTEGFLRSTRLVALLMFPLSIGLAATSATVVSLFFQRWTGMASMLLVLSAFSLTRPISQTMSAYLQAVDRPITASLLEVLKLGATLAGILAVGQLSPVWVCIAVGLAFALPMLVGLWAIDRLDGVPLGRVLLGLLPPLVACVPMVLAVIGVRHFAGALHAFRLELGLGLEVAAGALAYTATALVVARAAVGDIFGLMRRFMNSLDPVAEPRSIAVD